MRRECFTRSGNKNARPLAGPKAMGVALVPRYQYAPASRLILFLQLLQLI